MIPTPLSLDFFYPFPRQSYGQGHPEAWLHEDDRSVMMFVRWLEGDGGLPEGAAGFPI